MRGVAATAAGLLLALAGCTLPDPIRVLSFNIRYGTASDGPNAWPNRRPLVVQVIRDSAADLVGLQEVLEFQAEELVAALPEYELIGVGRDDGARGGEMVPVMYLKKRFTLVNAGHFWLSQTPENPGSVGWDAALPRLATWAHLRFRSNPLNEIRFINTHLDHRGVRARAEAARLIRNATDALGGTAVIVTGDFNCAPGDEPHRVLTGDRGNAAELRDSYVELGHSERGAGTFCNFRGETSGPRIDWILCNRRFDVVASDIIRFNADGRYPSDHFPVTATLRLRPATTSGVVRRATTGGAEPSERTQDFSHGCDGADCCLTVAARLERRMATATTAGRSSCK
ncbi:MAG: endonuclease/exonuclease/phosphatase family protein [Phycisphaerae bacterium]|jgi:endonuclease/exonuclease/phosphatase family metal-dependent hydrolase